MKKTLIIILLTIISLECSYSVPKRVIIIRHAEKYKTGESLNPKGLSRAGALPYYFAYNPLYNNPSISFVFVSKMPGPLEQTRTYQTCKPTADFYNLPIDTDYTRTEFQKVAKDVLSNPKYDNSTILFCWNHENIGTLVEALGGSNPGKWNKSVFDQVYILNFSNGKPPTFQKELQELMYGDQSSFKD